MLSSSSKAKSSKPAAAAAAAETNSADDSPHSSPLARLSWKRDHKTITPNNSATNEPKNTKGVLLRASTLEISKPKSTSTSTSTSGFKLKLRSLSPGSLQKESNDQEIEQATTRARAVSNAPMAALMMNHAAMNHHTSNISAGDVLHQSWLFVKSSGKGNSSSWKCRWVVLRSDKISYYNLKNANVKSAVNMEAPLPDEIELAFIFEIKSAKIIDFIEADEKKTEFKMTDFVQKKPISKAIIDGSGSLFSWKSKRYFAFQLISPEREIYFKASLQEIKNEWLSALESALKKSSHFRSNLKLPNLTNVDLDINSANPFLRRSSTLKRLSVVNPPADLSKERNTISESNSKEAERSTQELLNDWEIPYQFLNFEKKVGEGNYGFVFKGKLWDTPVALKTLKITNEVLQDFKNEITILSRLRHPNVVLYIGAASKLPDVCIVTEWCDKASLSDLLYSEQPLDFSLLMHIAIDIAQGMNYLHSLEPQIIHRDLKSGNVLLDKNYTAKVCDFGLSFKKNNTEKESGKHGILGTPEWMAPEVMNDQSYNHKVDVYSFGIVLCELFSRIKPYSDQFKISSFIDAVDHILDEGAIPTIPKWCGEQLEDLIRACIKRESSQRPSFSTIVATLRAIYDGVPASEIFFQFEIPRIMEMILCKNEVFQKIACKELMDIQLRQKTKFECKRCRHSPEESQRVSALDEETLGLLIMEVANIFSSKNEDLILHSLMAFYEIITDLESRNLAQCRSILREHGGLKRLLVFLSSQSMDIRNSASKVMLHLTNELDAEEQLKFFDLSYAGLSALAALSGGYRGVEKLKAAVDDEKDQLIQRKLELEALILQKTQLSERLKVAQETMQSKFEIEAVSTLRRGTLFGKLQFKSDDAQSQKKAAAALNVTHIIEEDDIENSEIPIIEDLPLSFVDYYGDFKRTLHAYALIWDSSKERWELRYLFLYGDEIRVFVTHEGEPDDPLNILYIDREAKNPCKASTLSSHDKANCIQVSVSGETFTFSFRTNFDSLLWAHWIEPSANEAPSENKKVQKSSKADGGLENKLSAMSQTSVTEALQVAKGMPAIASLPEAFQEYFEGLDISNHGYLAVNDVISGHWVHRYCILVNGVLRVFGTHEDSPDDCQMIVYTSGSMASPQFEIGIQKDGSSEWAQFSFVMKDDAGVYCICAKSLAERDQWVQGISPS